MATKRPLCNYAGEVKELIATDNIPGAELYHGVQAIGTVVFDNSSHVLSIATITYWYKGALFTTASPITGDIDVLSSLVTNKMYYFYFDDVSGSLKCSQSSWSITDHVPIATVFWNGSAGAICKEWHGYTRNLDWHIWAHDNIGTMYESGLGLTYPTVAVGNALQIETGNLHDEDLEVITGQCTTCRIMYKESLSVWTWVDSSLPYAGSGVQPQYLDVDTYALANVGASDFACMWVYGTPDTSRPIYIVPTHAAAAYNTIALARSEAPPRLSGFNLGSEFKLIYRFIYKGNGDFQESNDYRKSSPVPSGGLAQVNAGAVSFIPSGNIAATSVQTAINELDTEKAATGQKLDDFGTPDDNTDLNANTTNHGLLLKAVAPSAGLTNFVAIENGETAYKSKALFDVTAPSTQAYGDSAAVGTAVVAARRDHKHAMPAASGSLSRINKTQTNSPYTVTAADCDGTKVFTNTGTTGQCILVLPNGADGYRISMLVTAAYEYIFLAEETEKIRVLNIESKAGGRIKSNVIGHLLQLDWSGTQWAASTVGMFWDLETS